MVQSDGGTGVHIGDGRVLTCAHVVEARGDDTFEERGQAPPRIGRQKLAVCAAGRTFLAACAVTLETVDGSNDVALLVLGAEVPRIPAVRDAQPTGG